MGKRPPHSNHDRFMGGPVLDHASDSVSIGLHLDEAPLVNCDNDFEVGSTKFMNSAG